MNNNEKTGKTAADTNPVACIDGYEFLGTDADEKVLTDNGLERLTADKGVEQCDLAPETLLEKLLHQKFPGGYNNTGDEYFIVRKGHIQYYIVIHAGQWFAGDNAADENTGSLINIR